MSLYVLTMSIVESFFWYVNISSNTTDSNPDQIPVDRISPLSREQTFCFLVCLLGTNEDVLFSCLLLAVVHAHHLDFHSLYIGM